MSDDGPRHELFEHTADVGIRARGASLAECFIAMAEGLRELIAEDSRLRPVEVRDVHLSADTAESLLLAWLQQLLVWFSTDRFLAVEHELTVTETAVRGRVRGGRFDPARDIQGREVKAITRHGLSVRCEGGRWLGQVIVDI